MELLALLEQMELLELLVQMALLVQMGKACLLYPMNGESQRFRRKDGAERGISH